MPSRWCLQGGFEREHTLSKCRYRLQRFNSDEMLIVGMEHSGWAALDVWTGPSVIVAPPLEALDNWKGNRKELVVVRGHTLCNIGQWGTILKR